MDKAFHRKNNRLPKEIYHGCNVYYITICTADKQHYFKDENTVSNVLEILKELSIKDDFSVLAYVFMPDHCHLLLDFDESEMIASIKKFKQLTGYYFKQKTGKNLWQKSFYDHILRREENIYEIVKYILDNPVRAQLVRWTLSSRQVLWIK